MKKRLVVLAVTFSFIFTFIQPANALMSLKKCGTDPSTCTKKENTQILINFSRKNHAHYVNEHQLFAQGKISTEKMAAREYAAAEYLRKNGERAYGDCSTLILQMSNIYASRAATYFPENQVSLRAQLNAESVVLEDQIYGVCNQFKRRW